jgi:hypothetical protein
MIDHYTTGLCFAGVTKVLFSLINLSLPHFWRKSCEKRFSVCICLLYTGYLAENRNAYILRHSLRVTTAGPDGRF